MRCCVCLDFEEEIGALRCGHIFCLACIEGQFQVAATCPTCRAPSRPDQVVRLYPDNSKPVEDVLASASAGGGGLMRNPLVDGPDELARRLQNMGSIMEVVDTLGVETGPDELRQIVQSAEASLVYFTDLALPVIKEHVESWGIALQALRKNLKYSERLRSAKQEIITARLTISTREDQIRSLVEDKVRLQNELNYAREQVLKLNEASKGWLAKYNRIDTYCKLQDEKRVALHKHHMTKVKELEDKVSLQNLKALKYKKKAIALRQAAHRARVESSRAAANEFLVDQDDGDDGIEFEQDVSLEITDAPAPIALSSALSPSVAPLKKRRQSIPGAYPSSIAGSTSSAYSNSSSVLAVERDLSRGLIVADTDQFYKLEDERDSDWIDTDTEGADDRSRPSRPRTPVQSDLHPRARPLGSALASSTGSFKTSSTSSPSRHGGNKTSTRRVLGRRIAEHLEVFENGNAGGRAHGGAGPSRRTRRMSTVGSRAGDDNSGEMIFLRERPDTPTQSFLLPLHPESEHQYHDANDENDAYSFQTSRNK